MYIPPIHEPTRYKTYMRIVYLWTVIILIAVGSYIALVLQQETAKQFQAQARQLGNSLVIIHARALSQDIVNNDIPHIEQALTSMVEDPHVVAAAIYGPQGQRLAQYPTEQNLLTLHQPSGHKSPLIFVQEINHEQHIRGYIRLMLDEDRVLTNINALQQNNRYLLLLVGILTLLISIVCTRRLMNWSHKKASAKEKALLRY